MAVVRPLHASARPIARGWSPRAALRINRQPTDKPHARLRVGDVLTLPLRGEVRVVEVLALAARRGPAPRGAAAVSRDRRSRGCRELQSATPLRRRANRRHIRARLIATPARPIQEPRDDLRGHRKLHPLQIHGLRRSLPGRLLLRRREHAGDPSRTNASTAACASRNARPRRSCRTATTRPPPGSSRTAPTPTQWPNITRKGEAPADADEWKDKPDKAQAVLGRARHALTPRR